MRHDCHCENFIDFRRIKEDICEIREGLKEVCEGVKDVEHGCICEGEQEILEGICDEERGLKHLFVDLEDICCDKHNLEKALCEIREGIKYEKHGLAELLKDDFCEGLQKLNKGIEKVECGLKEVIEALRHCNNHRGW